MKAKQIYDRASQTSGIDFSPSTKKSARKFYISNKVFFAATVFICLVVLGLLVYAMAVQP